MVVEIFHWPVRDEFRNRQEDLAALESWWESPDREPINMYGRRRVGKSWLFRRFAHGKPAVVLVAAQDATPDLALGRFADELEPVLGVRPQIDTVAELFTVLYRIAQDEKTLVVIDEFPYLLGTNQSERNRALTMVQAVMEQHRDRSKIKLILAGSLIAEMERLQEPKSPMYGRLRPLTVEPLQFPDAEVFLDGNPVDRLTRFAVTGGMPKYLALLGTGNLRQAVVSNVLDRRGVLFDEIPALIHGELTSPAMYFEILEALATGSDTRSLGVGDIAQRVGKRSPDLSPYLETLKAMRLAEPFKPVGAGRNERNTAWRCSDHFVRFWFRFVRPYQAELEAGADPDAYYRDVIEPKLAGHTSVVFEREVQRWVRSNIAGIQYVRSWWGSALHAERRAGRRHVEEIDVVATAKAKDVRVVGEAKWTNRKMGYDTLGDLIKFKIPAMLQAGYMVTNPEIVLASRSGFVKALIEEASVNDRIHLVDADQVLNH